MPRRKPKLREDVAERAHRTLQEALGERPKTIPPGDRTDEQKNPEAIKRGRKGGERGGPARMRSMTPKQRAEAAKKAAAARWDKK